GVVVDPLPRGCDPDVRQDQQQRNTGNEDARSDPAEWLHRESILAAWLTTPTALPRPPLTDLELSPRWTRSWPPSASSPTNCRSSTRPTRGSTRSVRSSCSPPRPRLLDRSCERATAQTSTLASSSTGS